MIEKIKQWIINIAVLIAAPLFLGMLLWNILSPETFWHRLVAFILSVIMLVVYIFVVKWTVEYIEEQSKKHPRMKVDAETKGFHWQDGWFFEREGKNVIVKKFRDSKVGSPLIFRAIIPAYEWCSIIASMSGDGETSNKWIEAKKFHGIRDQDTEAMH